MFSIEDPYDAWCLDEAISMFGGTIEGEVNAVEGKNRGDIDRKIAAILHRYLGTPQRFTDPAMMLGGESLA